MTSRLRVRLGASAAGAVVTAWFLAQLLLARHAALGMYADQLAWRARVRAAHPAAVFGPVHTVHPGDWVWPAVASLIAVVSATLVVAALTAGGQRRWAVLPAMLPLAVFVGGLDDGHALGLGWLQPFDHLRAWFAVGAGVDAAVLLAVAGVLAWALPRRTPSRPALPALVRTVPVAIVVTGWWLVGHALPDARDRVWVVSMLLFVVGAAVTATLRLPWPVRAGVLLVLPFLDAELSQGLIGGWVGWSTYAHHAAVAVAVAGYVAGVPALLDRVRHRRPAVAPAVPV